MGEQILTSILHFRGIPVFPQFFFRKSVHTFGNSDFIFQNFWKIPKECVKRLFWVKICGSKILNFAFFYQNFDFTKFFLEKFFEKSKFWWKKAKFKISLPQRFAQASLLTYFFGFFQKFWKMKSEFLKVWTDFWKKMGGNGDSPKPKNRGQNFLTHFWRKMLTSHFKTKMGSYGCKMSELCNLQVRTREIRNSLGPPPLTKM